MRVRVAHNTTPKKARNRIEKLLENLSEQYSDYISDLEQHWEEDRLVFDFKAKGMKAKGTLEITEGDVLLDGKLPLLAKPFESKIQTMIEKEAKKMFG